jgi:hypothetical protein
MVVVFKVLIDSSFFYAPGLVVLADIFILDNYD